MFKEILVFSMFFFVFMIKILFWFIIERAIYLFRLVLAFVILIILILLYSGKFFGIKKLKFLLMNRGLLLFLFNIVRVIVVTDFLGGFLEFIVLIVYLYFFFFFRFSWVETVRIFVILFKEKYDGVLGFRKYEIWFFFLLLVFVVYSLVKKVLGVLFFSMVSFIKGWRKIGLLLLLFKSWILIIFLTWNFLEF